MNRTLDIIILVLVALGALASGAGVALYFAYPNQVQLVAGETRAFLLSLNPPQGTVTTEENAAFKGAAAPQPRAAPTLGAAAGDWPSYNKTLTPDGTGNSGRSEPGTLADGARWTPGFTLNGARLE